MNFRKSPIFLASLLLTAPVYAQAPSLLEQVQEVTTRLSGVMDTSQQAARNPKAPKVRITACSVQVEDATLVPGNYLYQEQALSAQLDKPYRQRLLRIAAEGQAVVSASYKFADPKAVVGLCAKPERRIAFKTSVPPDCVVTLRLEGTDYSGSTPAAGCAAHVRGAIRITNTVDLRLDGMDTQDRGFDQDGKQVWGAQEEPYQFRRLLAP
ncbi:chromophore lyase CpcT/CpeT [Anthocerotibacter panamensis]|uniref:chromophore lyase CpcT/CpeT n=1 Tax=Anthocerotibacter panamensis TaxID=2857077 RepID=UPI001C4032D1|nr:chromophore lyase CpcT/CpeT [Anthocerotibacter panamensis]